MMSAVTSVELVWPLVRAIISTSEPTLANLLVTYPSMLNVVCTLFKVVVSFGAGICAMVGAKDMQASKITINTLILFIRVREGVTIYYSMPHNYSQ